MKLDINLIKNSIINKDFHVSDKMKIISEAKMAVFKKSAPAATKAILAVTESPLSEISSLDPRERILLANDLMQVYYFDNGQNACKSVARIHVYDVDKTMLWYGTCSLISEDLILTNNHVLPNSDLCKNSLVEFNFQLRDTGVAERSVFFKLKPGTLFITDEALDFTVVAVDSVSEDKESSIKSFGSLRLSLSEDNYFEGACLSIIQHPTGDYKKVALRENQLIEIKEDFVWYQTDTNSGSSGAPVFNDNWEMVALHHSGVPETDDKGFWVTKTGRNIDPNSPPPAVDEDDIIWKANEGVKINKIVDHLKHELHDNKLIKKIIN